MKALVIRNLRLSSEQGSSEILDLAKAAKYQVVDVIEIKQNQPHKKHYLQLKILDKAKLLLEEKEIKVLIIGDRLYPHQVNYLEDEMGIKIVDKPTLILEIFEKKANSKNIKLQVQLAQMRYQLPRMVSTLGEAVKSEKAGFGGTGEQVTNVLVSDMKKRIRQIEGQLERMKQVSKYDTSIPKLPIVGFYSAGKTSLFNILSGLDREVNDEAFTTMIVKSHRISCLGYPVDIVDTVGLVDLPPDILSAFELMLSEIFAFPGLILCLSAELSLEKFKRQYLEFSRYIERFTKRTPRMLVVLSKVDLCSDDQIEEKVEFLYSQDIAELEIMKFTKFNPEQVRKDFQLAFEALFADMLISFYLPSLPAREVSKLYEIARIEKQQWRNDGTSSVSGVALKELYTKFLSRLK